MTEHKVAILLYQPPEAKDKTNNELYSDAGGTCVYDKRTQTIEYVDGTGAEESAGASKRTQDLLALLNKVPGKAPRWRNSNSPATAMMITSDSDDENEPTPPPGAVSRPQAPASSSNHPDAPETDMQSFELTSEPTPIAPITPQEIKHELDSDTSRWRFRTTMLPPSITIPLDMDKISDTLSSHGYYKQMAITLQHLLRLHAAGCTKSYVDAAAVLAPKPLDVDSAWRSYLQSGVQVFDVANDLNANSLDATHVAAQQLALQAEGAPSLLSMQGWRYDVCARRMSHIRPLMSEARIKTMQARLTNLVDGWVGHLYLNVPPPDKTSAWRVESLLPKFEVYRSGEGSAAPFVLTSNERGPQLPCYPLRKHVYAHGGMLWYALWNASEDGVTVPLLINPGTHAYGQDSANPTTNNVGGNTTHEVNAHLLTTWCTKRRPVGAYNLEKASAFSLLPGQVLLYDSTLFKQIGSPRVASPGKTVMLVQYAWRVTPPLSSSAPSLYQLLGENPSYRGSGLPRQPIDYEFEYATSRYVPPHALLPSNKKGMTRKTTNAYSQWLRRHADMDYLKAYATTEDDELDLALLQRNDVLSTPPERPRVSGAPDP